MRMMKLWKLGTALLAVVLTGAAQAAVTLPSIFGDHMVLQQGETIPVWGWAEQGEEVTVTLGKQTATAVTGEEGAWRVDLRRMKTGGPYELTIAGQDDTRTISDVLIGEVWVGSGQSNMGWPVKLSNSPEQEIAAANYPEIRLFSVELKVATEPQDNCRGTWVVCTPGNHSRFLRRALLLRTRATPATRGSPRAHQQLLGWHTCRGVDQPRGP